MKKAIFTLLILFAFGKCFAQGTGYSLPLPEKWKSETIPFPIDLVDGFRPAAEALTHAQAAVDIRARAFWLQLGIVSAEAGALAAAAGLDVVMDRCTLIEHQRCLRAGLTCPRPS